MMKALLVVVTITGTEYNVNMPNMKTCMEQARVVSSQGVRVETLCIPRVDNSAKVKEVFNLFGSMIQKMQKEGGLRSDTPYNEFTKGYGQLCRE